MSEVRSRHELRKQKGFAIHCSSFSNSLEVCYMSDTEQIGRVDDSQNLTGKPNLCQDLAHCGNPISPSRHCGRLYMDKSDMTSRHAIFARHLYIGTHLKIHQKLRSSEIHYAANMAETLHPAARWIAFDAETISSWRRERSAL
eukprot:554764-Amphidinium_carterae.1